MSNKPILSTQADLASSQTAGAPALVMPTGVVLPFAGTAAPTGWLACDGTAISRTTYAALFSAVGTSYGVGDGSTTFNLPDFRGRFPRFNDAMFGGSAAGRDSGRVLGSAQGHSIQQHGHTNRVFEGSSGATYSEPLIVGDLAWGTSGTAGLQDPGSFAHNGSGGVTGLYGGTSPSVAGETRPINLSINAIIKV